MNWTGGRLQRHSKSAAGGIVHRQKQHFAKARTRLQNGSTGLYMPFRPSYLEEAEIGNLRSQLPAFGRGSVGHAGHSRSLLQAHRKADLSDPDGGRHAHSPVHSYPRRTRKSPYSGGPIERTSSGVKLADLETKTDYKNGKLKHEKGRSLGKRRESNHDPEALLLEANRRRLLTKDNWVGLVPSRPVNIHFRSKRDKDRIGKRRKVDGRVTARHEGRLNDSRSYQRHINGEDPGTRADGGVEDIKIRIGSDALTNFTLTQPDSQPMGGGPPREASSDLMLFDTENKYLQGSEIVRNSMTPRRCKNKAIHSLQQTPLSWGPSSEGEHQAFARPIRPTRQDRTHEHAFGQSVELGGDSHRTPPKQALTEDARSRKESLHSALHITQHIGGAMGPLRLIFEGQSDVSGDRVQERMRGNIGRDPSKNAATAISGHLRHQSGNGQNNADKGEGFSRAFAVVDDAPWTTFLNIEGYTSSRLPTLDACRPASLSASALQPHLGYQPELEGTLGSQRATIGDKTRLGSSSFISASLPSVKPAGRSKAPKGHERDEQLRAAEQSHRRIEGDELWKQFVFEDEDPMQSESGDSKSGGPTRGTATPSRKSSSRPPPSSLILASAAGSIAVSSESGLVSQQAVDGSGNLHHADDYDCDSGSPILSHMNVSQIVSSPVVSTGPAHGVRRRRVGEQERTYAALAVAPGDFGETNTFSVTHPSLKDSGSYKQQHGRGLLDAFR